MNYRNQDLTGRDFSNQELRYYNFRDSNLTGCNFTNSDITGCNFRDANLTNAVFDNVIIHYANLKDTNQTGTSFAGMGKYSVWIEDTSSMDMTSEPALHPSEVDPLFTEVIKQTDGISNVNEMNDHDKDVVRRYSGTLDYDADNPLTGPYPVTQRGRNLYVVNPEIDDGTDRQMEVVLNISMKNGVWYDAEADLFKPKV
jgi:hypothetical protein